MTARADFHTVEAYDLDGTIIDKLDGRFLFSGQTCDVLWPDDTITQDTVWSETDDMRVSAYIECNLRGLMVRVHLWRSGLRLRRVA